MEQKKINSNSSKDKTSTTSKPKHKNTPNNFKNNIFNKYSLYKNLPFFSYKILEAKHSTTPDLYQQILLNDLILRKKSHFCAYLNEIQLNTNIFRELLKRLYSYEESRERIPKYVSYYQNYLKFFCRPVFGDYAANKKMVKHMEKVAQIFYNENYAEEDEEENSNRKHNQKYNFKVFNKTVREEIDNYGNYTRVDNENKKNNNYHYEDMKSKTIDVNKRFFSIKNNGLDLLESVYKITPILIGNKINKYKNKKNSKEKKEENDSNNSLTEYNSFQKIIKIMENKRNKKREKEKEKEKETSHKKNNNNNHNNNKISSNQNQNSNIFDYFNSLSNILFSRKKKAFLNKNKNNSVNNKTNKKKEKLLYNMNNNTNKIINNINININHLTIGQKPINPLSELNNNWAYKKYKKRNEKMRKNNSMILKDKSFKNYMNCFGNLTSKNIEPKKRNNSFKFPSNGVLGYNSNKYKKITNINFTSNTNNTRNKSNIKKNQANNNGYITSLHKISNKRKDSSKKKIGKITIYTNNTSNSNYIKNMHNILDININNNSKKIKHSNYNSNNININYNSNINSFYKNSSSMSLSPLVWSINKKNISMNKGGSSIISYERIRSTSNKNKKSNKIFSSGFNFNLGSKSGNNINFISPTNNIMVYQKAKLKMNIRKEKEKEKNNDRNISSPFYRENIPIISKNNSMINKKKFKDEIFSYSKVINLKFKNLAKLSSLKKSLKIPKKSRNKSKSKSRGKNISKK